MIVCIGSILILIGLVLIIINFIFDSKCPKPILKSKENCKFAILIPAKDESKVIETLLRSIKLQVDSLNSTYVIVESLEDPTCEITEKYGGNIIVRKNLNLKRKGYALDEAIKEILQDKSYDLYFIFDADNILDKNFIKEMLKTYKEGYDIGIGYRNIKNNQNVITTCSGLTFSMVNTLLNKHRMKINRTITVSGTGYYIDGDLIEKWQGFPFHSLTEDYELSLYASANNLKTFYNESAIFYDEQPTKLTVSIIQRTRWVKGFLESRKIRVSDITADFSKVLGITPYLLIVIGLLITIISSLIIAINNIIIDSEYIFYLRQFIISILGIYFILSMFTIIMFFEEKNKMKLTLGQKIKAVLYNPIFLSTYIICLVKALTTKVSWDKIEHGQNKGH